MDCHEITPEAAGRTAPSPPSAICCGLAITLLLHGLGTHPATWAVLSAALRRMPASECCPSCLLLRGHDIVVRERPT